MRQFRPLPSFGRYNLTISHQHKFVWFRVAKAGTRTILNHLQQNNIHLDVEHAGFVYYSPGSFTHYFKFAFVRNPWDRLTSCWLDKVVQQNFYRFDADTYEKMKDFGRFVDFVATLNIEKCDRHLRLQSALVDLNHVDYLGRMERFNEDVRQIFLKLNISQMDMKPKNVTLEREPYQSYYTQDTVGKVTQIYRKDIQIFGYTFE